MKIIYPIYLSLPSPLARSVQIVNTCYQLALAGVDVDLICARNCDPEEIKKYYGLGDIPANFNIKGLPALIKTPKSKIRISSRLPWDFFLTRYIRKSIKRNENPIVYLRELKTAKALMPIIKHNKIPSVYEAHKIEYRVEGEHLKPFEAELYSTVSRVVCITGPLAEEMQSTFKTAKLGPVLPSGCTAPDLSKLTPKEDYLFYAGQLYRWKGVNTIISMMKYLSDEHLVIAGGNQKEDVEKCQRLAQEEGVAKQITFLGQLPPSELPTHAIKAKALLLPNGDELYNRVYTSPIKLFEYLCYTKAIIASKLPTIEEIVTDNKSALLATADDPESFANAVKKLNNQPELVAKISKGAFDIASKYSWQSRALKIKTMLKEINNDNN